MTFEEYNAELERLRRERDAVLAPLDEQIERLTEKRQQLAAFWDKQLQELHQQYIAAAPYKVGDIVRAESGAGHTRLHKITKVQLHPWKDGGFYYWGAVRLKSGKWANRGQILGNIVAVESTEDK